MQGTVLSTRRPSHRALSYKGLAAPPIRAGRAVATCVWFPEFSRISGTYSGWGAGGLGDDSWGFFTQIKYLDVKIFGSLTSPPLEHWLEQTWGARCPFDVGVGPAHAYDQASLCQAWSARLNPRAQPFCYRWAVAFICSPCLCFCT